MKDVDHTVPLGGQMIRIFIKMFRLASSQHTLCTSGSMKDANVGEQDGYRNYIGVLSIILKKCFTTLLYIF